VVGVRADHDVVVRAAGREGPGATPPTERTLFEIGSVTKVFTATVLADEVVRGNLALDQPVRDLLPAGTVVPRRDDAEITLEHLATHRSGLPRNPVRGLAPGVAALTGRDPFEPVTPEALLDVLGQTSLRRTPGIGAKRYSNFGFALLGLALVHSTGSESYAAMVEERVCRPLGLADTVVHPDADQLGRTAEGHRWRGRPVSRWALTGLAGAGALLSTAADMLEFLAAQLDPETTPLAEPIRLTQQPRVRGRSGIGLGWMWAPGPSPLLWHNGGTGGFRSFVGFLPQPRRGVVVLSNHARFVDLLALRLLGALDPDR
jgi:CubicO group peptidase (beta-lactamase class C family)